MKQSTTFACVANKFSKVLQGYTKGIRFVAVLMVLLTMGIGQAWGETIYTNTGTTGTINGITASGNINANNGNTKPSFGLTSSSKNTITLTGLNLTSYTNVAMTFDYQLAKSGSSFSSLTVTQYNSSNVNISTKNITGSNNTSYTKATIALQSACTKITIVCNPAGSTYNTYVDNINITGDLVSLPWFLKGSFDNWGDGVEMEEISTGKASVSLDLAANTQYEFKFVNGSNWLGNNGTINSDISNWVFKSTEDNVKLNSGLGGTFTFTIDYSASTTQPKVSITYPRKDIYMACGSTWCDATPTFFAHAWRNGGTETYDVKLAQAPCESSIYIAENIPAYCSHVIFTRQKPGSTELAWSGTNFWNQSEDITISTNDLFTCTGWNNNKGTFSGGTYTPPTYTITFSGNGNTGGSMSNVTGIPCEGSTTLATNGYTRTGYTFNNWKTNVAVTANSSSIAANGFVANKATISNITSNITLTAQWKANTYTITLNGNNGSGHTTSVTATYNSATLSPSTITNPTRAGYTFGGWYSASGGTGSMVIGTDGKLQANVSGYTGANGIWIATASKTLYAKWTPITYYVKFNANGGSGSMSNQTFTYGTAQNLTANAFIRTGYTFAGWTTNDDGSGTSYADKASVNNMSTTNGAIVNLYAKWTKVHTITWKVNGQQYGEKQEVVDGQTIGTLPTKPSAPTSCSDKEFMGWTESATVNNDGTSITYISTSTKPDGDKTYHAVFATKTTKESTTIIEKTKTETFENQSASTTYNSTQNYTAANSNAGIAWKIYYGTVSESDVITGSKSAQMRWYDSAPTNLPYIESQTKVSKLKSISYYVITSDTDYKYSVSYSTNGTSWTAIATNQSASTTKQTKTHTINANGVDAYIKIAITSSSNVNDKAKFRVDDVTFTYLESTTTTTTTYTDYVTSCIPQYTITLNPNGGTIDDNAWKYDNGTGYYTQTIAENTQLNLPTPTHANNYEFVGWNDGADNHIGNYAATSDVTLTAQWQCIPPTSVTVDGTYHFFPGETITLTATPEGGSTPYKYQWQKLVVDEWQDIDQATSATYTKVNATKEDVGHYRCEVSSGNTCEKISDSYNVKCLQLYVYYDDHTDNFNLPLTKVDATTATASVNLVNAGYTYYFKLTDGCEDWYGNTGTMTSGDCTNWLMDANEYCGLTTTKYGDYLFTVDYSDLTQLKVSVTYPSGDQEAGKVIYWDNHDLQWSDGKIYYRIGHSTHNGKIAMTKVPGTANLYQVTTIEYAGFEAWHIANNGCWSEDNSIYKTNTGDEWAATAATAFITNPVTSAAVTVTPSNIHSTGGEEQNNNCEFYQYDITNGMKKHNAKIIAPAAGGTITVSYTDHDGTAKSDFTSGDRDLAHTCLLTITATPDAGYNLGTLIVNDVPFTSGNVHTLAENAVIKVVWEKKIETALSWSAPTCTATIASPSNEFPTLTVTPEAIRAGVQYSSSNPAVATIDATGRIVLKSAGTTTIRAYYEEDNTYASAEDRYELTVEESTNCRWEEVTIDDIEYGDEVVIAMAHGENLYALPYNSETASNSNPIATPITTDDFAGTIANELIWYITKGEDNIFTLSPKTATDKYLTCNSSNNAVRINTGTNRTFTIENDFLKNINFDTYLAISTTAQSKDWRHYESTNTTIVNRFQTLKFYKRVCLPEGQYRVTWMVNGQEYTKGAPTTIVNDGSQVTTLPTIPDDYQLSGCTSKKFIGWTTDEILVETDDAPTMFTDAASSPTINTNQTFHALFADVEEGEEGWAQVTTTDDLIAGDIYTIGSSSTVGNGNVLGAQQSNNRAAVSWNSGNLVELTLGGSTDAWTLSDGTGYLYAASSFSNQLKTQDTNNANGTWSINFSTNTPKGSAIIIAQGSNTRNVLRYNVNSSGNPLFSCYKDSEQMAAIYLFKKLPGTIFSGYVTQCCTPWEAPTLSATTTSISSSYGTTQITCSGTTHGNVTYTSSNEYIAGVAVNSSGKVIVTGRNPGYVTITATWDGVDGAGNYCPAESSIDITVTGSFKITYDANHANATGSTAATTIAFPTGDGNVASNGFALAGHEFVKWNTQADGSGDSYNAGDAITLTNDITLYAIWQRYCTITYVIPAGGGTLAAGATTTVVAGGALQMPGIENNSIDLEYSCEELIGWTTNSATHEAAGLKPDQFYAIGASLSGITQNTTLYAVYSRAGNGLGGTVTLTTTEMEGWEVKGSYGTVRDLTTCDGTWTTNGIRSASNPIQISGAYYVKFPEMQGNITQVVLNVLNGSGNALTSGTMILKDGSGTEIGRGTISESTCTINVSGSNKTAYLYGNQVTRIANISISYGPAAIISTTLSCTNDIDECTVTYDLNESFLAVGTQVLGSCTNSTFRFSEIGEYTICSEPQANEYRLIGWNNQCDGKGSLTFTPGQVITSLPQNIITLYAQWAPEVIVHDSYEETKVYPTEMGGSITLNPGQYICDPQKYEFIGWTTEDPQLWQQQNISPTLLEENQDGTVTFTPTEPSQVYAVYAIEDMANSDAFRLSSNVEGTTYYVGYDANRSGGVRARSNIEDALTFYKEIIDAEEKKYLLYYIDPSEQDKEYLYYSGSSLSTSNNPSTNNYGWIFHTSGTGYKFQSIGYQTQYLSITSSNVQTNTTGSVFNIETIAEYKYVAKTNCSETVTITFVPGNGTMRPSTNPVTAKTGDVIMLPTCVYEGWDFLGWVTENIEITEFEIDPSRLYNGNYEVGNSDVTLYAYYTQIPESAEFDGTTSEVYKMYCEVSDKYYYAISHGSSSPGTLPSSNICLNAEEWVFTNTGEANVYYIQDHNNLYLTPEVNNTQLFFTSTPFPWKVVEIGTTNTYRIYAYNTRNDDYSRLIMFQSGAFYHSAKNNEGNSAWHHVTIGGCQSPVYTTDPQPSKVISLVGSPMITSTINQTVKASQQLQLVLKDMEANTSVTIAGDGLTFYDADNNEVTTLQTGSNGSLTATLTVAYTPTVADNQIVNPAITVTCGSASRTFYNVACRSLPNTFAIVAKVGGIWYALPSQGLNSTDALVGYPVEVDNLADPTAVTAVPTNADWSLRQVYASSRDLDRFKAGGHNLVFVNNVSPEKALNPSSSSNYLLTNAQYNNYHNVTTPGLYEWTPTTTDLETYQLTNVSRTDKQLNIATNTVFGVHATEVVTADVRFLPIQNRYTPMAAQVVEWKENSVVVMYNGDPAKTASVSVNAGEAQTTTLSSAQKDIAVYELAANGLATNPTQRLSITIGTEKAILPIPYIISGEKTDLALLPGTTVAARQEVAKVADLVVLKDAKLTAAGASGNYYKFRNMTIYGGGKLVIPSDKGFGVASLTLRAGGITDAGEYDYVYPQFELRGTFTNTAGKFYYDYITDYDHWYHLVLPFAGELGSITYPTEFYGSNVTTSNSGSWIIKRYAGDIRATGNYKAWVDIETDNPKPTATTPGVGYIFWGAPKKVTVNGETARQKWGIQRITMSVTGPNAMTAENGDKAIAELSSYANVPNNSGKDNDQGWNLIGNPYMVNLTGLNSQSLQIGQLIHELDASGNWTGKWHWDDTSEQTGLRYVTIPSDHFDTYTAQLVSAFSAANPMVAGRAFFVQIAEESVDLMFTAANRASLMPQHLAAQNTAVEVETGIILSNETMQDEVNFWIKDGKTNDYEYNADYPKTPNNTNFNIYGVHAHGDLSWVATGPEYAEESMPIGYQVPAAGTYTLSISETYYSDLLDALYVTDHALSPEVTVDLMSNSYEFSVNQAETNNERFTVSMKLKSDNEGTVTGLENTGVKSNQPIKFIYQDKIFILHNETIYDATGKKVTTINK